MSAVNMLVLTLISANIITGFAFTNVLPRQSQYRKTQDSCSQPMISLREFNTGSRLYQAPMYKDVRDEIMESVRELKLQPEKFADSIPTSTIDTPAMTSKIDDTTSYMEDIAKQDQVTSEGEVLTSGLDLVKGVFGVEAKSSSVSSGVSKPSMSLDMSSIFGSRTRTPSKTSQKGSTSTKNTKEPVLAKEQILVPEALSVSEELSAKSVTKIVNKVEKRNVAEKKVKGVIGKQVPINKGENDKRVLDSKTKVQTGGVKAAANVSVDVPKKTQAEVGSVKKSPEFSAADKVLALYSQGLLARDEVDAYYTALADAENRVNEAKKPSNVVSKQSSVSTQPTDLKGVVSFGFACGLVGLLAAANYLPQDFSPEFVLVCSIAATVFGGLIGSQDNAIGSTARNIGNFGFSFVGRALGAVTSSAANGALSAVASVEQSVSTAVEVSARGAVQAVTNTVSSTINKSTSAVAGAVQDISNTAADAATQTLREAGKAAGKAAVSGVMLVVETAKVTGATIGKNAADMATSTVTGVKKTANTTKSTEKSLQVEVKKTENIAENTVVENTESDDVAQKLQQLRESMSKYDAMKKKLKKSQENSRKVLQGGLLSTEKDSMKDVILNEASTPVNGAAVYGFENVNGAVNGFSTEKVEVNDKSKINGFSEAKTSEINGFSAKTTEINGTVNGATDVSVNVASGGSAKGVNGASGVHVNGATKVNGKNGAVNGAHDDVISRNSTPVTVNGVEDPTSTTRKSSRADVAQKLLQNAADNAARGVKR